VFETLLHYSKSANWEEALLSVIPQRKGAKRMGGEGGLAKEEVREC